MVQIIMIFGAWRTGETPVPLEWLGIVIALTGSLASGLGYAVWYTALQGLTLTRAAVVQLCVPIVTAMGGVAFLSETISQRLLLSSGMILGGIWVTIIGRRPLIRIKEP